MKTGYKLLLNLTFILIALRFVAPAKPSVTELEQRFAHPPDSARPWVYWFWLNGNVTSNGITSDLEAMKRVGIGGVLIMEVDQGTPKGPADFGHQNWRELFKHVCAEANRLGLEVNMNNDAGWCGSGGPWITPELAMQKLVWTETNIEGPLHFEAKLPQPEIRSNYYGEIAVFAFPTPKDGTRIDSIQPKAAFTPDIIPPKRDFADFPSEAVVPAQGIIELTRKLQPDGTLRWDVPVGNWTVLRLGNTTTGKDNHPAPEPGRGLESDKLSKEATDVMFAGLMGKLIQDSKSLAGKTLVRTHIDSWETGSQNWTPRFREEFRKLRGYDMWRYMPVIAGRTVDSPQISERFLWDVRQTVSDLLIRNYAARFRKLAHRNGLELSIEAYGSPCEELKFGGQADEPMAEFWSWGYNGAYSCTEMSSAAHIYGKPILGAEAFTASDGERWLHHPASIKALGDWAFCEGINRFVFHRYALQPWDNVAPGISMGPWGLHYERTQTWWNESAAWHEYLARCQYLLQQGLFVADLCYLQPEDSPQRFSLVMPGAGGNTPDRAGYNFDGCNAEVLVERMKVKDGALVLPDGMSYRMLVLSDAEAMTPRLLQRIRELVKAGATVAGIPPSRAPGLTDYPKPDLEIRKLVADLWGEAPLQPGVSDRKIGKGHVLSGTGLLPGTSAVKKPENPLKKAKWIWHEEGNPLVEAPVGRRYFQRVFEIKPGRKISSAQLALTADNSFEAWINGQAAGVGDNFKEVYKFDVKGLLKPGTNIISVEAVNGADKPNPAGLIASLQLHFANGADLEIKTDRNWHTRDLAQADWRTVLDTNGWRSAMDLGPYSVGPWNLLPEASQPPYRFPPYQTLTNILARQGIPPDFDADASLRYIHKRLGDVDLYFIANPGTNWIGAQCRFRVAGKTPELLDPISGEVKQQPLYEEKNGRTAMPVWLEPLGSVFVVFKPAEGEAPVTIAAVKRDGADILPIVGQPRNEEPAIRFLAGQGSPQIVVSQSGTCEITDSRGRIRAFQIADLPQPIEITKPWNVAFEPNRGAPPALILTNLLDWSTYSDAGVKYFSGHATYQTKLNVPAEFCAAGNRLSLDLGDVAVIAHLRVNGKDMGILWKAPFRADVTEVIRPGENDLNISVVNLWVNRMIGDEQLPEDSKRNNNGTLKEWPEWVLKGQSSPTDRFTFTSWKLWKKDSPLQKSGLLGPVQLSVSRTLKLSEPVSAPAGN